MTGKIPQGRNDLRQSRSWKRPTGKDSGGYRKRGWWTLAPQLWHGLSPHSVCKKSPNLLAALLPLLWPKPETMLEVGGTLCCKGRVPSVIRPQKECIKSCETCFANTLNLNDKGPSMKWVCFPKVLWSFSYLTLTQNKPSEFFESQSSLNVIYLIVTAWQWLMSFQYMPCIPMQIKPVKACQGKGQGTLPLRSGHAIPFPPLDSVVHEFVSFQPQCCRHCLPVTASHSYNNI